MTILLIEDDKRLANFISVSLIGEKVIIVDTLAAAQEVLLTTKPNLLLIDLNLPDSRGLDTLRALNSFIGPRIVITERSKDIRLDLVALGLIDYIEKSGALDDLVARIRFNVAKLKPRKPRFNPETFTQIQAVLSRCKEPALA